MQQWIDQAREHWKEFQPKRYRQLKLKGTLGKDLYSAAEQTMLEMEQLQAQGMSHLEAWEATREKYLFPAPEQETLRALEA